MSRALARLLLGALIAAAVLGAAQAAERVATAIVFAVDVSGSVNDERYELQRAGIAAVFADEGVEPLLEGGLAVALIEWSDEPSVALLWTILRSPADAHALGTRIHDMPRITGFSTGLSVALLAAADLLDACPCAATNRIIDLSGDGPNNGPISTPIARDQVVARGFRINGLPIVTEAEPGLAEWYQANVVGGPGGFIEVAHGFEDFARAMRRKFRLEVATLDRAPAP